MAQAKSIIALDISTHCGVAWGCSDQTPRSTTWELGRADDGLRRHTRLLTKLRDLIILEKADIVVVEAPLPQGGNSRKGGSSAGAATLIELSGVAKCTAFGMGVPLVISGNVQTVRVHFVQAGRPVDPKKVVLQRCVQLGYLPAGCTDDNRGDACALWDWAAHTHARRTPASLVMFGARA